MSPEQTQSLASIGAKSDPSLWEHLAQDHRRLPMLLTQTEWRVQQKLFPGAERCFAEFRSGLEAHLGEEEGIASIAIDRSSNEEPPRINADIRTGHEMLRRMVTFAADAIQARNCELFASAASDLRELFATHCHIFQT